MAPTLMNDRAGRFLVAARIRPKFEGESPAPSPISVNLTDQSVAHVFDKEPHKFDTVFTERAQQKDVYEKLGKPLLDDYWKGFNVSAMSYGQTGAGKTHSMFGATEPVGAAGKGKPRASAGGFEKRGIVSRFMENLMREKENRELGTSALIEVRIQMVEIYCEKMFDLLHPSQRALDKGKGLPASLGGRGLSNAANIPVKSNEHVKRVLEEADDRRAAAVLKGRSSSSRSHTVAVVNLWQKTNMEVLESSAIFVDLAGSEDMTQSGLSQQEVNELRTINLSLFHLRSMVEDLAKGVKKNASNQNNRSSKLTDLLGSTLSGHSMVTLLINLSPCAYSDRESHRSLKFGMTGAKVKVNARVNKQVHSEVAIVVRELEKAEEQERSVKDEAKLRKVKLERQQLQSQLGAATAKANQRLDLEKQLQAAWIENVQDLWSVTETLRFGFSPVIKDRWSIVQHLVNKEIDHHECTLDRGVRNSDSIILSAHRKVQKWLRLWEALGAWKAPPEGDVEAAFRTQPAKEEGAPSTVLPTSKWEVAALKGLGDATKDLQHDLWDLENRKDAMNTSYIQLSASLGTLGKEIMKAAHQVSVEMRQKEQDDVQMKRKDYELSAAASLASRVIERARQMLANKQILMEDKKAEVMEQLDSCMLVDLRGFFSRIQGSGSSVGGDAWSGEALQVYGPRFEKCKSWRDMLDLVVDIVDVGTKGLEEANANKAAAAAVARPGAMIHSSGNATSQPGANGAQTTGPASPVSPAKKKGRSATVVDLGDGLAAWVASDKGIGKLHIMEKDLFGKGEVEVMAATSGILLSPSAVRHLCSAASEIGVAVDKAAESSCKPDYNFEMDLDPSPRVFGGVASRQVSLARLEVKPDPEDKWSSQVDIRDWGAKMGSRKFDKSRPPRMEPIGQGVTLNDVQWKALDKQLLSLAEDL